MIGHVQPAAASAAAYAAIIQGMSGDAVITADVRTRAGLERSTEAERDRILAKSALFDPPPAQLAGRAARPGRPVARRARGRAWPRSARHRSAPSSSGTGSITRASPTSPACPLSPGRCRRSWPSASSSAGPRRSWRRPARTTTRKFLFRFRDGQEAETVYIPDPEEDRGAVCISSQVGCTLSCRFCHTGTQTPDAQPRRGGDRRPVHGGARCLWRVAVAEGRNAAPAVHHRADGHGRAAVQLRQRRQGDDRS